MPAKRKLFSLRKITFFLTIISFVIIPELYASKEALEVGKKVPDWLFKGEENYYRLNSWPNKMVIVYYGDPSHRNMADNTNNAIIQAVKNGQLTLEIYQPVVIVNCIASMLPNFIIRNVAYHMADKSCNKTSVAF